MGPSLQSKALNLIWSRKKFTRNFFFLPPLPLYFQPLSVRRVFGTSAIIVRLVVDFAEVDGFGLVTAIDFFQFFVDFVFHFDPERIVDRLFRATSDLGITVKGTQNDGQGFTQQSSPLCTLVLL
ncbi:uncharacterized protein ARMOST_19840 [Armillaria ostoyae]|uniref:Uncharacterized protein n=1 Tax=Armillaria ostoyae TaxID=47428 RepID=A0A284S5P0_ARMOS|nr:uncharacterized protein ARMOST_19840 [Armillaria ostoyae]